MSFVAAVTFVMYHKVHLLLDDIVVVAAESDEWCLRSPQMHRTLFHFLATVIFSTKISRNNCVVLKLNHEKTDAVGGPETKD